MVCNNRERLSGLSPKSVNLQTTGASRNNSGIYGGSEVTCRKLDTFLLAASFAATFAASFAASFAATFAASLIFL